MVTRESQLTVILDLVSKIYYHVIAPRELGRQLDLYNNAVV